MMLHLESSLMVAISITAMMMSHPVSITVTIIIQTILAAKMIYSFQITPWFSYTLFLVFLGGMLILFSYITSLASNFSFKPKMTTMMLMMITFFLFLPFSLKMINLMPEKAEIILALNKFFFQDVYITVIITSFLLIILFVVTNITTKYKGPLQTNM